MNDFDKIITKLNDLHNETNEDIKISLTTNDDNETNFLFGKHMGLTMAIKIILDLKKGELLNE